MHAVPGWRDLPPDFRGASLALGNFDGVHRGHVAVLNAALDAGAHIGAPGAAAVFDPHPRAYFQPDAPPFRLMSAAQRDRALAAAGLTRVHVLPFDADLAAMTPETFVNQVLVEGLGAKNVAVGADFRFGAGRAGDGPLLARLCAQAQVGCVLVRPLGAADEKYASSGVRAALRAGEPERAAAILGRPWAIEGAVQQGDQRGRLLGFPTANIGLGDYLRARFGVYVVDVQCEAIGLRARGVANLGERPTVGGTEARLEVHVFDFDGDLYGRTLDVALVSFLRGERRFDGLGALKAQIAEDAARARSFPA